MVTLDASAINRLRSQPAVTGAFPFLMATRREKCANCPRRKATYLVDYEGIKNAVASMSTPLLDQLKVLLKTDKIKILRTTGSAVREQIV